MYLVPVRFSSSDYENNGLVELLTGRFLSGIENYAINLHIAAVGAAKVARCGGAKPPSVRGSDGQLLPDSRTSYLLKL